MFLFMYMLSFVFVVNMDDWFLIWFGLELNMFSFLLLIYEQKNSLNIEACFKYFFVQSVGSALFVSSMFLGSKTEMVGTVIMIYKMGGGPFFFWFPSVCGGISWFSNLMLMSFQKFLPLVLLKEMWGWMMWLILVVSLLLGVMGAFNQNNAKYLMAYSSIHQIGWLLMCMYVDMYTWLFYYLIYILVLFTVIMKLMEGGVVNLMGVSELKYKWWLVFMMMNLGGMPPMLGFFLKWFGIYNFMTMNFYYVFVMIIFSVIMFYIYLRVCYNIIMGGSSMVSWVDGVNLSSLRSMEINLFDSFMIIGVILGGFIVFMLM